VRIGINTRHLLAHKREGFGNYTFELVTRICAAQPEHEFVLYFDRKVGPEFQFPPNVRCKVLFPPTRHPFLYLLWFNFSLKRALRKDGIQCFWSPDGQLPTKLRIPSLASIHDLNFEHFPDDLPFWVSWYYRTYFPVFAQQATKIITVSETTKADLRSTYNLAAQKIQVIYNGVYDGYHPLASAQKEATKKAFTNGSDYLLFVGSLHPRKNIRRLIEAFVSISNKVPNHHLLIVGENMWGQLQLDIPTSIKERIHFTGHLPQQELTQVMGAASCFVYVPYFEGFGMPLTEAMAAGVPIVAGNKSCLPEIAQEAAFYVDPFDVQSIAAGILHVIEDPKKQAELIQQGLNRVKDFNWDRAAKQLWNEINQLVS
jgi:glycosyltransferase involved in cell wall biosynthesis